MTCLASPIRFTLFRLESVGFLKFVYSIPHQVLGNIYDDFFECVACSFFLSSSWKGHSQHCCPRYCPEVPLEVGSVIIPADLFPPSAIYDVLFSSFSESFSSQPLRPSNGLFISVPVLFRSELSSCSFGSSSELGILLCS